MQQTWKSTRRAFLGACLALPALSWSRERTTPALMLASVYREELAVDLSGFWVSEKFDGVRAYWDGSTLMTRAGNEIRAPAWFTAALPDAALDGELWGGHATFERTSGVVRTKVPDDRDWRAIRYMLFDLPSDPVVFYERRRRLIQMTERAGVEWLAAIPQQRIASAEELAALLRDVEARGGEGLMLHRATSRYVAGRSQDLLKLKSFEDAEAQVIGHEPGRGKYTGMLGALLVRRQDGATFRIGSGLSDAERKAPPLIGVWVTYAHNGLTNSGLPRFPRYLRVRDDFEEAQ